MSSVAPPAMLSQVVRDLGVSAFVVFVLRLGLFKMRPSSWEDEELICEAISRHHTFRIPDCYTRSARPLNLPLVERCAPRVRARASERTLATPPLKREKWCQM